MFCVLCFFFGGVCVLYMSVLEFVSVFLVSVCDVPPTTSRFSVSSAMAMVTGDLLSLTFLGVVFALATSRQHYTSAPPPPHTHAASFVLCTRPLVQGNNYSGWRGGGDALGAGGHAPRTQSPTIHPHGVPKGKRGERRKKENTPERTYLAFFYYYYYCFGVFNVMVRSEKKGEKKERNLPERTYLAFFFFFF